MAFNNMNVFKKHCKKILFSLKKWRQKTLMHIILILVPFIIFCQYGIYYLVIVQCSWPTLDECSADNFTSPVELEEPLKAMFITDTHLVGPHKGYWLNKLRTDWQMHRAYTSAVQIHKPEIIFILGDLFDEGERCNRKQFQEYVDRFHSLFPNPENVKMFVVPGNHDIGFHYSVRRERFDRFNSAFNATAVEWFKIKGNYFVLINSMALEQDDCFMCRETRRLIKRLSKQLNAAKNLSPKSRMNHYSRPVLLQHFPMFRKSDEICNEPDEASEKVKKELFREKWDCLSKDASELLLDSINPRVIITGHTHHGCHVIHRKNIHEYTVSSFSWRNKNNPNFMLGIFTSNNYSVKKCDLPRQSTVIIVYCLGLISSICYYFRLKLSDFLFFLFKL